MRSLPISLTIFAAVALLASCGGGSGSTVGTTPTSGGTGTPPSSNKNQFLFVAETTQDSSFNLHGAIESFSLDPTSGALTAAAGSPYATNYSTSGDMTLTPNNDFAYIVGEQYGQTCCVGPSSILEYSIDPTTGVPTQKQAVVLSGTSPVFYVNMHPSGSFLYASPWNNDDTGIALYSVQSDGSLNFTAVEQGQGSDHPIITPDGKYLYTHTDGAPVGNWTGTSACGPVITNLWAYSINASSGALTAVTGSPFTFQRQECQVGHASPDLLKQVDPASSRLFIVDQANNQLDVFSIDASTGALTQLSGDDTGQLYSSAVMDPKGNFLYVGSIDAFYGYSLTGSASTGTLPPASNMPLHIAGPSNGTKTGSTTMAIDPAGKFLFSNENGYTSAFGCCSPDDLVELQIDVGSGALTQIPAGPTSLAGTASKMRVIVPQ